MTHNRSLLTQVNLFATWHKEFIRDSWNYFDCLVVLVSLLTPVLPPSMLPPAGSKALKLGRTLRVFRLIKRIPSMRKIVSALIRALPAMFNAFFITVVLMSLYSIIAVRYLKGDPSYGEWFRDFFSCLFTFWQITTGDDWSVIVRALMANQASNSGAILVGCFFSSYQLLISMCMINVVVCVLVDGFETVDDHNDAAVDAALRASFRPQHQAYRCPLASLSMELVKAQDLDQLHDLVNFLYEHVGGGAPVCFEQLRTGLGSLPLTPPVIFTPLHWVQFVKREGLCYAGLFYFYKGDLCCGQYDSFRSLS